MPPTPVRERERTTGSSPATRVARAAVGAIFCSAGVMYGSWLSRIMDVQRVLDVSPAVLGIALVGSGIGSLAGNVIAAIVHHRVDSRTSARLVGVPFAASLALIGLAPNAVVLFLALVLCGLTFGILNVSMNLQGAAVERIDGRPALPLLYGLLSIGALIGAAAGVFAAAASIPPWVHFLVVSVVILLAQSGAWPALVTDPKTGARQSSSPRQRRPPWRLAALALAAVMAHGTVGDWSAIHLSSDLHASSGVAAVAPFLLLAALGLGQLAGNDLLRRLGTGRLLRLSGVVAAAGLLGLGLAPTVGVALTGIATAGLGMACVVPVVTSAAAEGVDSASGVTLVVSAVSSTDLLGPAMVGLVASAVGLAPIFLLLAAPMLAVAVAGGSVQNVEQASREGEPIGAG